MKNKIWLLLLNYIVILARGKNIVLVLVDDLDIELDGMKPLTSTLNLIANKGATYTHSYAAVPICCPNRASILTGRYQHNHGVLNNSVEGGCSDLKWREGYEKKTFAVHLKEKMNYRTFYAGKYLNQYGTKKGGALRNPPGWDYWYGLVGNSKYYNYSLSINGTEKRYGAQPQDYLTDVISRFAVNFINTQPTNTPFLMVLAPPAAHAPFNPAARHNDKFKGMKAKRTPNFNNMPERDKHWLARMGPSELPDNVLPKLDDIYRRRWETLLAVDEMVSAIHRALNSRNLLNNTNIIFTSDHGYHIGQFGLPMDKRQPYETDIHIPLFIRGPGIDKSDISAPVSSVDIFATILDIAGLEYFSDGISMLKHNLSIDRTLLIEYKGESSKERPNSGCPSDNDPNLTLCNKEFACKCQDAANNTFSCIRRISKNFNNIFCVFEDNENYVEAYDFTDDPFQMKNLGYTMKRGLRHRFRNRLKSLMNCEDSKCVATGPDRL